MLTMQKDDCCSMSEQLYKFWLFCKESKYNKNIDCGVLRQIGKSYALRKIIEQHKDQNKESKIIVLIQNANMGFQYRDLLSESVIFKLMCKTETDLRGLQLESYDFFADEVQDVSCIPEKNFIAGFYSKC